MTLKGRTFTAVRWTAAGAVARAVLYLVQLTILARILSPDDYGLMAMVAVVLSFGTLFADLGVNSAYVQRQDVTQAQRSSLFWLNVLMGAGLTVLLMCVSPLLAWFFDDPRLTPLLMLSATIILISSIGQQVRMAAEKSLNFRPVVILEILAALLGLGTAVTGALTGLGVYALVLGSIVTALTWTVLAWIFIANGWRPDRRYSFNDVRPFLGFGGAMVGNNLVNQFNTTVDLLLGGRMLLAAQLGMYSVPRQLILHVQSLVNPIITRVGFPLIAQVQHDLHKVRTIYLKTLNVTASVNAPVYFAIAFFAPEIVQLLLGGNWTGAVDFFRILGVWGFLRSIGNPAGSLLFGLGRADLALKWNLAMLFILPPVLWVGSSYGAVGLAWALLSFAIVMFVPGWYVLIRPLCHATLRQYTVSSGKPALIAIAAVTPAYLIASYADHYGLRLMVGFLFSFPLYLILSHKFNHEWVESMLQLAGRKGRDERKGTVVV